MQIVTMSSKWGVQLEGDTFNLTNLASKINHSIKSPASFFFAMINNVHVLRTQRWGGAATAIDAFQLAVGDINLIRGCLDAIDGCHAIEPGTVYRFKADGRYDMSRQTHLLSIFAHKRMEDWASPDEFSELLAKAESDRRLRAAFSDLTPDTPWIDIYRSWESLKDFHGGEHKMHRAFKAEQKRIKQLTRTANSFRHAKAYNVVPDPMPREEAIIYLKDLLLRTAVVRGVPPVSQAFEPGQQVQLTNYEPDPGQPASLNKLSLGRPINNI
ncbi:hypothetical protein [Sphingomonas echinoides]|uniref:hypothetical protein n=1 Tax=Sphingomonas echinoides TaxID=59803 RepID=UPI002413BBCD|nr:hypothetical protein [Sphingomonas echinoides]